jgi:DNA-binding LytR/AlgR family response regulator
MQNFFFLKTNGDYIRVNYSDLVYIECVKNYLRIVTTKGTHMVPVTMKHIEEILPQDKFCKIHRSYIVSLNHIDRFNNKWIYMREKKLPISEQHRDIFMGKFMILTPQPRSKVSFSKN